jgi:hypothetical protein
MKKIKFVCLGLLLPLLVACHGGEMDAPWPSGGGTTTYEPIMMPRSQLETSVMFKPARSLNNAGKIYMLGDYIYISERYKGVHIINNTDPQNPVNEGFIQIPGNLDVAGKGNMLYVDNGVDLVTIDISDPQTLRVTDRIVNALPEMAAPDGGVAARINNRPADAVIVGWTLAKK